MYDTVLVPTDGSDHALRAAKYGAAIAEAFDATLHVVSVVDVPVVPGPFDVGQPEADLLPRLEDAARETVAEVQRAVASTADVRTATRNGSPQPEILAYADEHDVDLIAMGTHGRTGIDRYVAGSVAEGVVRHAAVPVLTVRAAERTADPGTYEDVLVPTDGSEFADAAVEHALEIARRFDARVHALHVVNVGKVAAGPNYTPPSTLLEDLESRGESATGAIAERARVAGLTAETHVRKGIPAADILDYATEHDVDLIAMGTAGRTGLNRFLLGSTTERVLRHADAPVLSVNARDRAGDEE